MAPDPSATAEPVPTRAVDSAARAPRAVPERASAPVAAGKSAPAQVLTSTKNAQTRAGLVKDPGF